jgi:hypothetical protein
MMTLGTGISLEKNPTLAAKEAIRTAKINMRKERVNLAIVFSSIDLASPTLLRTIDSALEGAPIIGASGLAVMSNQGIFKHGLAIMLISFPKSIHYNAACVRDITTKGGLAAGEELGEKLLHQFQNIPRTLSLILSDKLIEEDSNFIYGLQSRLGSSFPLIGAYASNNPNLLKTRLYFHQDIISDACAGVLFGGKLSFGLGVKHGWKPLGKPHTVTSAKGSVVEKIDDKPAVKFYEHYLDCDSVKLKKELKRISVLYPLGIYLAGEEEYLLRNIVSIEENGSLRFQSNVPQDSRVRLMIGTKETCLDATRHAVDEAKKGLSASVTEMKKMETNNFAIVFSSVSRYALLRKEAEKELDIIKAGLGPDTPVIGLYAHGELAPLRAANRLGQVYIHNQTVSVLNIGG